jgi:site-specific DNA recombinase
VTKTLDAVIRVSRKNNREGSSFLSPEEQRDTIIRYAQARGYTIGEWFDETDSVSGKSVERAGLQAALARALDNATDGIIVAKVDRFARSVVGGLTTVGQLERAGKEFVAVKDGVDGATGGTPTGRMLRGILFLFAQWQLETLTEGWENTRARHIANGVHTHEPYGYVKGEDRRLMIDESEATIVHRMFSERAEGAGWIAIAQGLNADGIPVRQRDKGRTAEGWSHTRIKSIVEARVYLGEIGSGEFRNNNAHPPIITADLWQRANGRRMTTARRDAQDYALTGLIVCAGCGVKMRGTTTTKGDNVYRQYKCRVNHPFGRCPNPANANADDIERLVFDRFESEFFGLTLQGVGDTSALTAATEELEEAQAALRSFATDISQDRLRDEMPDVYADAMASRLDRVARARGAVSEARNAALGVSFPASLAEDWPLMGAADRRAFLTDAFDLVVVGRGVRAPVAERFRIFGRDEAPAGIIGRPLDAPRPIDL